MLLIHCHGSNITWCGAGHENDAAMLITANRVTIDCDSIE
jgi:hypothetical protein